MSDQNSTPKIPTAEDGFNHLMTNIHSQVFFHKLAAAGFAPANDAQIKSQIELAGKLRHMQQEPRVKAAEEQNDPYAKASASLDKVLAKNGIDTGIKQAEAQQEEIAIHQAASTVMKDSGIYNSVLAIKAAEAAEAARQMGVAQPAAQPAAQPEAAPANA